MKPALTLWLTWFLALSAQAITVEDFAGRQVTLAQPAQRIVALAPHIVENLYSAGAGERLVGVVSYSNFPAAAQQIPQVGSYNAFSLEPRGKYIVRVCMGTACHLKGAGQIADTIMNELNIGDRETTPDMKYTLERVNCLGACALAPVITLNDKYYGKMTPRKMADLLKSCE